jgi:hypothetical protein
LADPRVALSVSMAAQGLCPPFIHDPEDPTCARVVLSGNFTEIVDKEEAIFAQEALFERHPMMRYWPTDHDWKLSKIIIQEIWLLNIYGGGKNDTPIHKTFRIDDFSIASIVSIEDYYNVNMTSVILVD